MGPDRILALPNFVKDYKMAGNTRGKLKEQFEGVHNNFTWSQKHLESSLILIQDHNPKLTDGVKKLYEAIVELDKLAQGIYHKL